MKIHWRRDRLPTPVFLGFPGGSAGKESTYNAWDLGSIPGLGRSAGEGKSYPLQCSGLENSTDCIVYGVKRAGHDWATFTSLHQQAQMVKNTPAMQETQIQPLGQEDPLEKGMATHSSILAWRIPWRSPGGYNPWGRKDSDTTEQLILSLFTLNRKSCRIIWSQWVVSQGWPNSSLMKTYTISCYDLSGNLVISQSIRWRKLNSASG